MSQFGFIHDKLDIKILILFLADRLAGPVDFDTLTELVMHHDGVNYFSFAEALGELVKSGHLDLADDLYTITEKGKANSSACETSLPYSVRHRCTRDLAPVNATLRRNAQVRGEKRDNDDGSVTARMSMDDNGGNLLTLELLCPSHEQADKLIARFLDSPEWVYNEVLEALLSPIEPDDDPVEEEEETEETEE